MVESDIYSSTGLKYNCSCTCTTHEYSATFHFYSTTFQISDFFSPLHLIPPPDRLYFYLCPLLYVAWLVCDQGYTKIIEENSMKCGWKMGLGPELTPLTFGLDRDKVADPGHFSHFL